MTRNLPLSLAAVAALASACGDDAETTPTETPAPEGPTVVDNSTNVIPSKPLGSVVGLVVDGNGAPLAGVNVTLLATTAPAAITTGADGRFAFTAVPAGSPAGVILEKSGYGTATRTVTVPGSAGNFPIDDATAVVGPIALFERSGAFSLVVVGWDGTAVTPIGTFCEASAQFADLQDGGERLGGPLQVAGTAGQGSLTCGTLPRLSDLARTGGYVEVFVPAQDANGDGIAEYDGVSRLVFGSEALTSGGLAAIVLPPPGASQPLQVIASSARTLIDGAQAALDAVVDPAVGVEIAFSRRVDVVAAKAEDERSGDYYGVAVDVAPSGSVLRVRPDVPTAWPKGRELHLTLTVATRDGVRQGATYRFNVLTVPEATPLGFAARDVADPSRPVVFFEDGNLSGTLDPGERVELLFDRPLGTGTGAAWVMPVYLELNIDADQSGQIGDYRGEVGSRNPIVASSAEPAPPAGFSYSGFTREAAFGWPLAYSVPAGTRLHVDFRDQARVGDPVIAPDGRAPNLDVIGELRVKP